MGELLLASSVPADAHAHYEQALAIASGISAQAQQARALEGIYRCHLHDSQPGRSAASLHQALAIYQRIGSASSAQAPMAGSACLQCPAVR